MPPDQVQQPVLHQPWKKLGLVYAPDGKTDWARTHANLPTPWQLDEERIRVFVSFYDAHKVGRLGFVDVSAQDPTRVIGVSEKPVLDIGEPGTFDDSVRIRRESDDGKDWIRKDETVGLDVSPPGWDSEMICFSAVQRTRHGAYLFYNGNNFGEPGFGVAVLDK